MPVHTTWKDPKTGEVKNVIIDKDDGIREGVTVEALGKLPAVFKKAGGRVYTLLYSPTLMHQIKGALIHLPVICDLPLTL